MRTKILILSTACAVAGSVAVNAQTVYSVNAVGYVNATIPVGFSIISNPLLAGTNTLSQLIPTAPDRTALYFWNANNGWDILNYYVPDGWDSDYTFAPGTGAWINNQSAAPFTITFVGEVPQGTQTSPITNSIPAGFSLRSSIVPQSGALDADLGFTPSDKDTIYLWRSNAWKICNFYADDPNVSTSVGSWDNVPDPSVGEGFWIKTSKAKTWSRVFSVNQ